MNRDGWMKSMMHFKAVCGANKHNPRVLFYDGHDIHFDKRNINILHSNHIKPFVLKTGDSGNDHPNDNGPNFNLKGLYGQAIINWQIQHGTLKFTNSHMNAVLVETRRSFQLSSAPVIINASRETELVPLTPPDEDTKSQAYPAASQTPKG